MSGTPVAELSPSQSRPRRPLARQSLEPLRHSTVIAASSASVFAKAVGSVAAASGRPSGNSRGTARPRHTMPADIDVGTESACARRDWRFGEDEAIRKRQRRRGQQQKRERSFARKAHQSNLIQPSPIMKLSARSRVNLGARWIAPASSRMSSGGSSRSEDRICRQPVRDRFSELPGGFVGL